MSQPDSVLVTPDFVAPTWDFPCPHCGEVIRSGFRDWDDMDMHISEEHPEIWGER